MLATALHGEGGLSFLKAKRVRRQPDVNRQAKGKREWGGREGRTRNEWKYAVDAHTERNAKMRPNNNDAKRKKTAARQTEANRALRSSAQWAQERAHTRRPHGLPPFTPFLVLPLCVLRLPLAVCCCCCFFCLSSAEGPDCVARSSPSSSSSRRTHLHPSCTRTQHDVAHWTDLAAAAGAHVPQMVRRMTRHRGARRESGDFPRNRHPAPRPEEPLAGWTAEDSRERGAPRGDAGEG
jgi:hypothetical protein